MQFPARSRKVLTALAATALTATGLAACGSSGGSSSGSGSSTVTIWSSIDQPVQDGLKKELVSELKAKNSKIKINWVKVDNINQLIITKIQAGDTPDIAFVPQPGVVSQMNALGAVKPMNDAVDMASLKKTMIPGSLDFSTIKGNLDGLLVSMNVKGLVFYNKSAFKAGGYTVPTTLGQLETLTNKIKASGTAPWCFGIESDTATGWPATDWIENLLLKQSGAKVYNEWVTHKIGFTSAPVVKATNEFAKLMLTNGNVYGGRKSIASTNFATTGNPLWQSPPKCQLQQQGSFIPSFYPKNIVANLDSKVGVFGLPPATAGASNGVEVGGDSMTMLNDSDNVKTVVGLLSQTAIGNDAAGSSSFISPHVDFDKSQYPNNLTRKMANVAYKADTTVYDASDQMPAAVGTGSFWKEMTSWISGQTSESAALKAIDASWPASS